MTGFCYIDEVDIYTEYGVIIAENGYNGFLTFPALVEPDRNDWPEYNGIEVDLSEPRLQPREITVPFAIINGNEWRNFVVMLASPGYRSVNIPALGKTFLLRMTDMPDLTTYPGASTYSISFVDDLPAIPAVYPPANGTAPISSVITLDGTGLEKYGIVVTDGLDELSKSPMLKKNLTRKNLTQNGQIYDTEPVVFAEKEVTFKCCLSAPQMTDFWNLYNAFFGDLVKTGYRQIGFSGRLYPAFYRKSGNFELHSHIGEVVCEFDVTLCFISFRIGNDIYLLSNESDYLIITENGHAIDLSY